MRSAIGGRYWMLCIPCLYILTLFVSSSHLTPGTACVSTPCFRPAGSTVECGSSITIIHEENYPILWIGDSRTVGLQAALQRSDRDPKYHTFICKVGAGCSYLKQMSSTIVKQSDPPHIIVINLGVNDLGNIRRYQAAYDEYLSSVWKNCPVYIISVNPVRPPCRSVSNRQIESFNTAMQEYIEMKNASASAEAYPIRYIDTYSYLQKNGYRSGDGLHYGAASYLDIYDYILSSIREPIGDGEGRYIIHSSSSPAGTADSRSSE